MCDLTVFVRRGKPCHVMFSERNVLQLTDSYNDCSVQFLILLWYNESKTSKQNMQHFACWL